MKIYEQKNLKENKEPADTENNSYHRGEIRTSIKQYNQYKCLPEHPIR